MKPPTRLDAEGGTQGARYDASPRPYRGLASEELTPFKNGNSSVWGHTILGAEIDGTFVYHLGDALSSVRDVVDAAGNVIRSNEWDEYGNLISSSGSGQASPKTWVGGLSVNDDTADSKLYNMGHRNYAGGVLGRFISRDPIGFRGGLNLYSYPANPVNAVDPSGLLYISGDPQAIQQTLSYLEMLSGFQLDLGGEKMDQVVYGWKPGGLLGAGPFATDETRKVVRDLIASKGWLKVYDNEDAVAYGICVEHNTKANPSSVYHSIDLGDIQKVMDLDYIHGLGSFLHEVAEAKNEFTSDRACKPSHKYAKDIESNFLRAFGAGGVKSEANKTITFEDGFKMYFKDAPKDSIVKTYPNGCSPRTRW